MTRLLYYEDSHIREFDAVVTSCTPCDGGYQVVLDMSAFFPGGGGQAPDTGFIGSARVINSWEQDGEVVHLTQEAVPVDTTVHCRIDWELRLARMQSHTAEHIVSGIVHARWGADNVGFHMGVDGVIVDFDKFLTADELWQVEEAANRVVMEDRRVRTFFPREDQLAGIDFRSKKQLEGDVRLVEIEGCDMCACCAPHVARTGEIGNIRILESIRRKDGVRLRMIAGREAYEDSRLKYQTVKELSALLSAKADNVAQAVRRLLEERDKLLYKLGGLNRRIAESRLSQLSRTEGNMVLFEPDFQVEELRILANGGVKLCGGICAAISGDDETGYSYVLASGNIDLRAKAKEINEALNGRGGGRPEMITGTFKTTREKIEEFFSN